MPLSSWAFATTFVAAIVSCLLVVLIVWDRRPKQDGLRVCWTARALLGHREGERSEKGYGEHGGKSVGHCYGRVPKWLPKPNERNRECHDC
jgi:hypothetical protein